MNNRDRLISALRRLEKDWPDDVWLFAADGVMTLMEKEDGVRQTLGGSTSMDSEAIIASFPGIECDGGDW